MCKLNVVVYIVCFNISYTVSTAQQFNSKQNVCELKYDNRQNRTTNRMSVWVSTKQ